MKNLKITALIAFAIMAGCKKETVEPETSKCPTLNNKYESVQTITVNGQVQHPVINYFAFDDKVVVVSDATYIKYKIGDQICEDVSK